VADKLRQAYEDTFFKDVKGQMVLAHLLQSLNHFATATDNPEVAIRQNVAKEILTMCNRWEGVDIQRYLNSLPRVLKEKEENE
jgi:hypothetical protein|tara:strand:+ start:376 stop:624 length:249 start_codon:yes stop_codon:yes gene_type:complete